MNLSISPGKNNVGAYINDINLKSLDQDQATEIKKILNQFGVIFIKEQNLDPETYQNFAKTIGQPVVYPRLKGLDKKFPFIQNKSNEIMIFKVLIIGLGQIGCQYDDHLNENESFKERISSLADNMAATRSDMLLSPDFPGRLAILGGEAQMDTAVRALTGPTGSAVQPEDLKRAALTLRDIASDAYDLARMEMSGRGLHVGPTGGIAEPT